MWTITDSFSLTFTIPVNIPWRCPLKTHVKPYYKSLNHLFSPVFPIFPVVFPWSSQVFFGVPYGFSPSTPGVEGFRCQSLGADLHLYPWPGSALWFVRSFVSYGGYEKMKKQWKYNRYTAILSGYVYIYTIPKPWSRISTLKKKLLSPTVFL